MKFQATWGRIDITFEFSLRLLPTISADVRMARVVDALVAKEMVLIVGNTSNKLARIKSYKSLTGCGLLEAKLWVEKHYEYNGIGRIIYDERVPNDKEH